MFNELFPIQYADFQCLPINKLKYIYSEFTKSKKTLISE